MRNAAAAPAIAALPRKTFDKTRAADRLFRSFTEALP
jgi:hypothetical protein